MRRVRLNIGAVLALLCATAFGAQDVALKQQAKDEFAQRRYVRAYELALRAAEADSNDAEAWFLCGWYRHYCAYDTRPLSGYSEATSDSIVGFLERATKLDPTMGDAYCFIGIQYGMRAADALAVGDAKRARVALKAGREKGGYPDWMLEYGRNMLKQCAKDAVLVIDNDPKVNAVRYLQLVEGYRDDVSSTLPFLGRADVILAAKRGVPGAIAPAPISWTESQILAMHAYSWAEDTLKIPVTSAALRELGVPAQDSMFEWVVKPNMGGGNMSAISAYTGVLMDLLETNKWRRPVYFAPWMPTGTELDSCVQDCGLVERLLPVRAAKYGLETDTVAIKMLLADPANFEGALAYKDHPMPHASWVLVMYGRVLMDMAQRYAQTGDTIAYDKTMDQLIALGPAFMDLINPGFTEQVTAIKNEFRHPVIANIDTAARDSVVFRTSEPAPTGFDRWAFLWVIPNIAQGARIGMSVRSGSGEDYYKSVLESAHPGDKIQSDFMFGQTNPSKLYGKQILVKVWSDKVGLQFPTGFEPAFEFYRKNQAIKRIRGLRREG